LYTFAPTILKNTARLEDPLERVKGVLSFVTAGFQTTLHMFKPFNPLLGETL
jgi:hypothetical protein